MAQPYKICPICSTPNHRNASACSTCGTSLAGAPVSVPQEERRDRYADYDYQHGETDLAEARLAWRGGTYLLMGVAILIVVGCGLLAVFGALNLFRQPSIEGGGQLNLVTPTLFSTTSPLIVSNTPRPTLFLPTVTQGEPTALPSETPTLTPTQGPCLQEVLTGDDLISIIFRCGHRNFDTLLGTVLEINNMTDPTQLQVGQVIEVPWPTATIDPNATITPTEAASAGETSASLSVAIVSDGPRPIPTETLQPGVTWHRVQAQENIIQIATTYGASLRILSDLNPEVTFSQCDFGLGTGGPNCVVQIYEGQLIRVPAPTPTPTIQPTPSGSETPTPTATPTFNAPSALSPSDLAFFRSDELVTLRWVATGVLGEGESYLVRVRNENSGAEYTGLSRDLFFIIPNEWHDPSAGRQEYSWTVSVVQDERPGNPIYSTPPRRFTWQGQEG